MLSLELSTFVTHVASQMLGRYLPMSLAYIPNRLNAPIDCESLDDVSEKHWIDLIKSEFYSEYKALTWIGTFLQYFSMSCQDFGKEIFKQIIIAKQNDIHILPFSSPDYPELLRHIQDPPLALFYRGNMQHFNAPSIGIVGSRQATKKACDESYHLGFHLCKSGFVVVSGGAFGVDIFAHEGVVAATRTEKNFLTCPAIVVFAGGLSHLYPKGNQYQFDMILNHGGTFVSERLPNAASIARDFPVRNRIIAGISETLALMQANEKSGAMTTAMHALKNGREVLVLEHDEDDVRCRGSQRLIEEGAASFSDHQEFLQRMVEQHASF